MPSICAILHSQCRIPGWLFAVFHSSRSGRLTRNVRAGRKSVLHAAVAVSASNNVFCYNGPAQVEVKPDIYTLPGLSMALWHSVLASGIVDRDSLPDGNPFDFGLTLDKLILAEGWEANASLQDSSVPSSAKQAAITYRHPKSGKTSDPSDGKPVKLVCSGRENFTPLNHHPKSRLTASCVYWTGL